MAAGPDAEVLTPGATLGRYTIVRRLGAGGMGAVYLATHTELRSHVALKTLLPELAASEALRTRFVREGRAAARIRHPHIVSVTDAGFDQGVAYLVMEYLEGEDLAAVLKRERRRLELARLADIMVPVCDAVAAAHDAGIVHRDLKPANIFLARSGGAEVPKVLDFGMAKVFERADADGEPTTSSFILGTPGYMSPEQVQRSAAIDGRSDQFTLGVILYFCASGHRPFPQVIDVESLALVASARCDPLRVHAPDLPAGFEALVMRALQRDPAQRFPSARDLARGLLRFARPQLRAYWEERLGAPPPHEDLALERTRTTPVVQLPPSVLEPGSNVSQGPVVKSSRAPGRGAVAWIGGAAAALVLGGVGTYLATSHHAPGAATAAQAPRPANPTPIAEPMPSAPPPVAVPAAASAQTAVTAVPASSPRERARPNHQGIGAPNTPGSPPRGPHAEDAGHAVADASVAQHAMSPTPRDASYSTPPPPAAPPHVDPSQLPVYE